MYLYLYVNLFEIFIKGNLPRKREVYNNLEIALEVVDELTSSA